MQIEQRPIESLIPYARNARTHSDAQVAQIAASIKEFGWTNPILVDGDNGVIAGHGRLLAARKLGIGVVPCIELAHLSETQKRAYVLADNQLALNAGWDKELLALELGELDQAGFDLELLGFDNVAGLLAVGSRGLTDPDDIPAEQDQVIAQPGEVWILGRHRLACGDCTDALIVERVLDGVRPHLMVTDPPYGVDYDADWRNKREWSGGGHGARAIGRVLNDGQADWRDAWALFPGDVAYVWHAGLQSVAAYEGLVAGGFDIRAQIIWAKSNFAIGRGDYHWHHEPCWYAVRKGKTGHYVGDRKQSTLWQIAKPAKSDTGHSTQKPVECMRRPIENNSSPGQAVYEPFSGSGTTLIACEEAGRACHAIELNPAYVDMAIRRWQAFTGLNAIRESDRLTFAEVENALREKAD